MDRLPSTQAGAIPAALVVTLLCALCPASSSDAQTLSARVLLMTSAGNPGPIHVASAADDKAKRGVVPAAVERAVAAHGGKQKLSRLRSAELDYDFKGGDFPLVAGRKLESFEVKIQEVYNLPHQIRKAIKGKIREAGMPRDEEVSLLWAIDGERTWLRQGEGAVEVMKGKPLLAEEQYRPLQIFEMLARYNEFDWTQVDDERAKKEKLTALAVRDPRPPGLESTCFFSGATGLLQATETLRVLPIMPRRVVGEIFYSDYKEIDGTTLPMKKVIYIDGKKLAEIRITRLRFLDQVDKSLFAPPK